MKIESEDFEEKFSFNEKKSKSNSKVSTGIAIAIAITLIIVIIIVIAMMSFKETGLSIYVDGKQVAASADTFYFTDDGNVYISIGDVAPLVNYEAHNGEYKIDSEDTSKMFVEAKDLSETTSFFLNSKTISKVAPNTTDDYKNIEIDEAVFTRNGKFYITEEGFMKAFNSVFSYKQDSNSIVIQTLPYLIQYYTTNLKNYGGGNYTKISEKFTNQKALIYGMIVASNNNGKLGVVGIEDGKEILGPRYSDIEFIESSNEFIITNANKVGIAYATGLNKIEVKYDEIKVLDSNLGYYLVKSQLNNGNKYGVINSNDEFVVHIEYDEIGIDTSKYTSDGIQNKYVLCDTLIPVRSGSKWGFYDIHGQRITDTVYDDIGAINTSVKDKVLNNTAVIGNTGIVVVRQDKLYGGIDTEGRLIVPVMFDYIYSTTSGGETTYYLNVNGTDYDALKNIDYLRKQLGITEPDDDTETNTDSTNENTSDAGTTDEQDGTNTNGENKEGQGTNENTGEEQTSNQ